METTEVLAIGRCPVKGCRNRRRHQFTGRIMRERLRTWTSWGIPAEGGEQHWMPTVGGPNVSFTAYATYALKRADKGQELWHLPYIEAMLNLGWVCEEHDRFMTVAEVHGVVNVDKTCTGRCVAATGGDCECFCGGANHGAAYDFAPTLF
jgi:hypothetical protein